MTDWSTNRIVLHIHDAVRHDVPRIALPYPDGQFVERHTGRNLPAIEGEGECHGFVEGRSVRSQFYGRRKVIRTKELRGDRADGDRLVAGERAVLEFEGDGSPVVDYDSSINSNR